MDDTSILLGAIDRHVGAQWCPHRPTPKQRRFLDLDCREALYGGAAGGGKSDALLMAALQYVDQPGYSAIIFRRTYADLSLPGAIMDRAGTWLAGTGAKWNAQTKTHTFPSGARLAFGYMEHESDKLRYQGAEFQFVGFDETTQFSRGQYTYLFSRLRRLAGVEIPIRMRGATNPGGVGHDWLGERFGIPEDYIGEALGHDGRTFIPARLEDNPHLDQEEYRQSLAELDSITRKQLEDGAWIRDSSGLVYRYDRRRDDIVAMPQLRSGDEWQHILGIDYGNVDATALVVVAFCTYYPELFVKRAEKWPDLTPTQAAEIVRDWNEDLKFIRMVGDVGGLGKGYAEEARRRFYLPIVPAQKQDKLGYIKLLNGDFEHDKVRILAPLCTPLIGELASLSWKDENHLAEHPGQPNDCSDALLYAWRDARHFLAKQYTDRPTPGTREFSEWEAKQMRAEREKRVKAKQDEQRKRRRRR